MLGVGPCGGFGGRAGEAPPGGRRRTAADWRKDAATGHGRWGYVETPYAEILTHSFILWRLGRQVRRRTSFFVA
jgi:hypothetical protein